jgi:acetyl-CoA/propionyl-CoA carboxylase biotin carboxyl carrier protein
MKRVLIANRGEIALRVIRACRDHGIESVAVYAEEDRDALHVKSADFAFSLNGVTATQTYLDISKIIAAAFEAEGVDQVWLDSRTLIKTNSKYFNAVVDKSLTNQTIQAYFSNPNNQHVLYISISL